MGSTRLSPRERHGIMIFAAVVLIFIIGGWIFGEFNRQKYSLKNMPGELVDSIGSDSIEMTGEDSIRLIKKQKKRSHGERPDKSSRVRNKNGNPDSKSGKEAGKRKKGKRRHDSPGAPAHRRNLRDEPV